MLPRVSLPVLFSQDTETIGGGEVAGRGGLVGVGVPIANVGDENLLELVETGTTSKLVLRLKLSAGSILDEVCKSISVPDGIIYIFLGRWG